MPAHSSAPDHVTYGSVLASRGERRARKRVPPERTASRTYGQHLSVSRRIEQLQFPAAPPRHDTGVKDHDGTKRILATCASLACFLEREAQRQLVGYRSGFIVHGATGGTDRKGSRAESGQAMLAAR